MWLIPSRSEKEEARRIREASRILRNETNRKRDTIPVLVIISDGIANRPLESPLNTQTRSTYINTAQADVIDAAHLLRKMKENTLVIKPSHKSIGYRGMTYHKETAEKTGKKWLEPTELLMEIPGITGGNYYGIGKGGSLEEVILIEALSILGKQNR